MMNKEKIEQKHLDHHKKNLHDVINVDLAILDGWIPSSNNYWYHPQKSRRLQDGGLLPHIGIEPFQYDTDYNQLMSAYHKVCRIVLKHFRAHFKNRKIKQVIVRDLYNLKSAMLGFKMDAAFYKLHSVYLKYNCEPWYESL